MARIKNKCIMKIDDDTNYYTYMYLQGGTSINSMQVLLGIFLNSNLMHMFFFFAFADCIVSTIHRE